MHGELSLNIRHIWINILVYKYYVNANAAKNPNDNIPDYGDYCITGAKHRNKDNHCSSSFHLWKLIRKEINYKIIRVWEDNGLKSSRDILDIMINNDQKLYSAKELTATIETGEKIEVEFRIAHNGSKYKISDMPET
ncbi:hypothetical protein [Komagataeibacter europaeus]|uniref:hypothetical protein n=1 Tax=Komagataeibacter europaeus TaxID=33995 RepID=UPI002232CA1E|nr:hypothetical protein [Komagataeibacter europaeus]